jgi:phospholipid/cholesterol/gamma-HCH transport system ATP-binding protein
LKNIGVLFQNGALLNSVSVAENVALPLQMHTDYPDDIIYELVYMRLEQVGLGNAFNLFPSELSGGMKKRVALARAIIMEPKIIFCDEPSAGLDPITARKLDDILLHLKEALNITLVVITHELESIKRISDQMIMLDKGKKIFDGNKDDLLNAKHPMVREFFKLG